MFSTNMSYKHEQIQSAYKKLSPEIQSLVMSTETAEFTENALKKLGLNQDQSDTADSEILYAMCNLQTLDTAIENISKLSGKSVQELSEFKDSLYQEIFSKYEQFETKQKDLAQEPAPQQPIVITKETKEDALEELKRRREQAVEAGAVVKPVPPSNLPVLEPDFAKSDVMIKEGEAVHEVTHVEPATQESEPVTPVVVAEEKIPEPATPPVASKPVTPEPVAPKVYGYPGGKDPYREPLD